MIQSIWTNVKYGKRLLALFLLLSLITMACSDSGDNDQVEKEEVGLSGLDIFTSGYPRTFQFRIAETLAVQGRYTYDQWKQMMEPYDGIVSKALNEIMSNRDKVETYMLQFKRDYPAKMVLLHFFARARDPNFEREGFFAGSWLYYQGGKGLADVPASREDTVIKVENTDLYKLIVGAFNKDRDNLVITAIGDDGKPDWNRAEQVILLSKDPVQSTITVRRGQFGTEPLSFSAGKMYIAAHVTAGPEGKNYPLTWSYNYSANAPRDPQGNNAGEVLAQKLAAKFADGGELAPFDGIVFDILGKFFAKDRKIAIDTDGDGIGDDGVINGQDRFFTGIYQFGSTLRNLLGDGKLLLADGMAWNDQRNFGVFNGMESEGWPISTDLFIDDWSGGMNRVLFWQQNAANNPAKLNYFTHRFEVHSDNNEHFSAPYPIRRLFFAASQITGSAVTFVQFPDDAQPVSDWDEMVEGTEKQYHWLGNPVNDAVRLAKQTTDLLNGAGTSLDDRFTSRLSGQDLEWSREDGWLKLAAPNRRSGKTMFEVNDIPTDGPDLTIFCTLKAELNTNQGAGEARLLRIRVLDADGTLLKDAGTFVNPNAFEASFYVGNLDVSKVNLQVIVEGSEPVWMSQLTVHSSPDAMIREFQHGLVLANPSEHEYTFDLENLAPGKSYHRIQGSPGQDQETNNGAAVHASVVLGAKDGLFLVRDGR